MEKLTKDTVLNISRLILVFSKSRMRFYVLKERAERVIYEVEAGNEWLVDSYQVRESQEIKS